MILLDLGAVSKGKNALLKALKLCPKNSDYWNNVGLAYERLGKTEFALRLFKIALEHDPNNFYPLHNLSLYYYQNGDEKQAVAIWKRITKEHPYDFNPFALLAQHYFDQNDFLKVKEVLEQTRERRQYDDAALWFIAEKYFLIGEDSLAKAILMILHDRDPRFYKFPYTLAQINIRENDLKEALHYMNKTIKIRPFDSELWFQKMKIMAELTHPDFLIELKDAILINPVISMQTLTDDVFTNYHTNSKYLEVIALARERHNFLSKPIFLLGSEFDNHPILKRMNYHLSLAIIYHYLILLGFSRITVVFNSLDYIDGSCLKHCHPDLFKQGIIQELKPSSLNAMIELPKMAYENNGLILSSKDFCIYKKNHVFKDYLEQQQIKYTLDHDDLLIQSNLFSLPNDYYRKILFEVLDILRK